MSIQKCWLYFIFDLAIACSLGVFFQLILRIFSNKNWFSEFENFQLLTSLPWSSYEALFFFFFFWTFLRIVFFTGFFWGLTLLGVLCWPPTHSYTLAAFVSFSKFLTLKAITSPKKLVSNTIFPLYSLTFRILQLFLRRLAAQSVRRALELLVSWSFVL